MRFINKLKEIFLLCISIVLTVSVCFAQNNTVAAKNVTSSNNQVVILVGIIALVLAFVIWGMGQVLVTIGKQALEKNKENKTVSLLLLVGLSLFSVTSNAQAPAATEVVNVVPNYGGMDSTAFWMLVAVIFVEVLVIAFMMFSIRRIQAELFQQKEKQQTDVLRKWWSGLDKKFFTKAVAVEKEADVLLDHDYDGIKELDNALPPWWKYGFIITIVVAFVYLLNFHVLGYGQNPTQEYQTEIANAQEAKEIYESQNKDKIDESNLKMPLAEELNPGKEIFTSVCWTCHGKLGEGGAGPNLTDDYWIHKGSLTDVYISIKHGYPDKGMQSWEKNYSPKEILSLAGFIKTLKGTNPANPKAPQGDLFSETATADTTAAAIVNEQTTATTKIIKTDSTNTKAK